MAKKAVNIIIALIFCFWLAVGVAAARPSKALMGKVLYEDSTPAPGAVVYVLNARRPLKVTNNAVMIAEHLLRAITDAQGRFVLDNAPDDNVVLFARDLQDYCAFHIVRPTEDRVVKLVIQEPAQVHGQLLKGNEPVKGKKVTAHYQADQPVLRYVHAATTGQDGGFNFEAMMPGWYLFQVVEDVPQVGCCFRSVVTKQFREYLQPGQQKEVKLGGTNLPYLSGKITDADGNGLHGAWVRLEPKKKAELETMITEDLMVVWSDVTERDGSYGLYDVPPGEYTLHCFRRLALNNAGRTLQAAEDVTVRGPHKEMQEPQRLRNELNVTIDLEPFMPLEYEQPAPPLSGILLDGRPFDLTEHGGKVVVLVFYASWCRACGSTVPGVGDLVNKWGQDKVLVLGINLDNSLDQCKQYVSEKSVRFPQLFAGPWKDSDLRKAYRVIDVPTSFVIDAEGKIAQIDLFGKVLEEFIEKLLTPKRPNN
ncbi:MAG: peroxiredoxin family protein [Planctomycetota bacterium]